MKQFLDIIVQVHLESNKLAFNEQSKKPLSFPSLTLLKYLVSKELISDPSLGSTNYKYCHYRMLFYLENYVVEIQSKGPLLDVKKCLKCTGVGHPWYRLHYAIVILEVGESKVITYREKIIKI